MELPALFLCVTGALMLYVWGGAELLRALRRRRGKNKRRA